ncbi:MAG TPA: hypothetical protein VKE51_16645 [Vicinamibacterales bacterium]|nr:hypothetical protein [Vicinamibacterales bacterium]
MVIGSTYNAGTLRIREFLTRNGHPFQFIDLDRDKDAQELLDRFHVSSADVPVLICGVETVLRNPTNAQIADCLGFNEVVDQTRVHYLVVVGAGPAGLAARRCPFSTPRIEVLATRMRRVVPNRVQN